MLIMPIIASSAKLIDTNNCVAVSQSSIAILQTVLISAGFTTERQDVVARTDILRRDNACVWQKQYQTKAVELMLELVRLSHFLSSLCKLILAFVDGAVVLDGRATQVMPTDMPEKPLTPPE